MLLELHIAGLGVIEDVTLELSPGLNVLTGETGTGKTMVTVGLGLALGGRARSEVVRNGASRARVEARFEAGGAGPAGDWAEDGELVLARTLSGDARSTARAGGQLCPVGTLAELGAGLVEVHGQHQTQRLLSPPAQLAFLDRFAGPEHLGAVSAYRAAHGRLREARRRLRALDDEAREREREKDLLGYQVREIEAARIEAGELTRLGQEESRLAHAERIRERLATAASSLGDEGGGIDALRAAAAAAGDAAEVDEGSRGLARRLMGVVAEADDAASALRSHLESVDLDPARLDEVRSRIAAIRDLERKYGDGEEGILGYLEESRARLAVLEGAGRDRQALAAEAEALGEEAASLASRITEARTEAAPRLAAAIEAELQDLGMEGATVELRVQPEDDLGPDGAESAILLFSGGSGQPLRPLPRVVSGGELSRAMLACRTVLADLDDIPTLVFDEVDAGIGGRAGVAVGRRLARLARDRQVLVVSHLPQIACFADRHFRVTKEHGVATVVSLDGHPRVEELSRMLSGLPTEEAATHAAQLLEEAAREKA